MLASFSRLFNGYLSRNLITSINLPRGVPPCRPHLHGDSSLHGETCETGLGKGGLSKSVVLWNGTGKASPRTIK